MKILGTVLLFALLGFGLAVLFLGVGTALWMGSR